MILCPAYLLCTYLQATRLNWYRDSSEWKPFHHDAAAIKGEVPNQYTSGLFLVLRIPFQLSVVPIGKMDRLKEDE